MRRAFHPEALDHHGAFDGNVDGLIDWIGSRHRDIPFSMHAVSNVLIEFAGPDLALVESYVRTTQCYPAEAVQALAQLTGGNAPEGAADLLTCSRYVDRFARRAGEWKILERTLVADWKQVVAVSAEAPKPVPGWESGQRSQEDFIFRERRAIGIG